MGQLMTNAIKEANGGNTVKETLSIIKNMDFLDRGLLMAAERNHLMSDTLLVTLDYLDIYGDEPNRHGCDTCACTEVCVSWRLK